MSRTITICNQKGGVGKTTTAINLSTSLAVAGKKVLIIDIDPQGNATSGIGLDKNTTAYSGYHIILGEVPAADAIVQTQVPNLDIIPSNINLTGAEVELVSVMGREHRLRKGLEGIKDRYDYIMIDCPPSLGLLTINALTAADSILIPIQCEYYALEGLSQLVRTVSLVKENLNPNLEIEGVLLTMADYRTNLTREVINEVRTFFSTDQGSSYGGRDKVYKTIIPRSIKLTEAPGFGKPIAVYDSNSQGAKNYANLAQEMLQKKSEHVLNEEVTQTEQQ